MLAAIGSCSPYLANAVLAENVWISESIHADPTENFEVLIGNLGQGNLPLAKDLRIAKRRFALLLAYHDLQNSMPVLKVTEWLSNFADRCLQIGTDYFQKDAQEKTRIEISKLVVLAMGKHGADELNYSSDIDFIVLFNDDDIDEEHGAKNRKSLIKATQNLVKLLSATTAEGFVFRTDLRLRPNPAVTPVCISIDAAERYYESVGRTWERAAMIKARPVAGDIAAGQKFLNTLTPFVWRKHLDFAAIQDAENMLLQIRSHKGISGPISVPGHDIKLGRGGIREIEFFAQTHQLIFGGRDKRLRQTRTIDALAALATTGRIASDRAEKLQRNYLQLRQLEHRLQMLDNAQTHQIPQNPEQLVRVAAFCGYRDPEHFQEQVLELLTDTHALTALSDKQDQSQVGPTSNSQMVLDAFDDDWLEIPALRSERARQIFSNMRPVLAEKFATASDPAAALSQFDAFLKGLPAGVQIFSLLEANENLLNLLVSICSTSPRLARYLGRNSRILDAVLDPEFFQVLPGVDWYLRDVTEKFEGSRHYEDILDQLRIWQKEQHFRVGVHLLRGLVMPDRVGASYSAIAEASVRFLLPHVSAEIQRRYGRMEGDGIAVVAMGKLGSREMTAESDLDLIVIYDAANDMVSDGPKQLPAAAYYSRLTQALISAMTVPTANGRLYEVDMRLRPSGRKGPVATNFGAFSEYQRNSAWTWEKLALTRSRVIAGDKNLAARLETEITDILQSPQDTGQIFCDVAEMREKLQAAKPNEAKDPWEVKHGPGRLLDIELFLQAGTLINGASASRGETNQISVLVASGWLEESDGETLLEHMRILQAVQHVTRLIGKGFSPDKASGVQLSLLLNATGIGDLQTLQHKLTNNSTWAHSVVAERLQRG